MQDEHQHGKRQIIEDRAQETKHQHEAPNKAQVLAAWSLNEFWVDTIRCDGHLRQVRHQVRQ